MSCFTCSCSRFGVKARMSLGQNVNACIFFYSVNGRTPNYSLSPVLTSAESPQPKAQNCSSTVHTWNTHHSRTVQTGLHQVQHMEELQPLIGYHYRGYIPSGFGCRALDPKEAVSHGKAYAKSLCLELYRRWQKVITFSPHRKLGQQLKILNLFSKQNNFKADCVQQ